ncbi:MAG TPA: radical SAM protein [Candidatus Polarisedimenticolia bacterium]|nr:radical SAM protein [Candidatus Polarisedimenticolia bacterium]
MRKTGLLRAWGRILTGRYPSLSIEITRECPLRCPGCYAYEPEHLGTAGPLRTLADYRGKELIDGVLDLVRRHDPVHLSIVGGEPLVRFRELETLLPLLSSMGVSVQLVTSAVRPIPRGWRRIWGLDVVVSIDGLQPEHDRRRAPATYDRILTNIEGHSITVHCTVTTQMAHRDDASAEFLSFWSGRKEVRQIWFSFFTPQVGSGDQEIVSPALKADVLAELARLRPRYPKLRLPDRLIDGFRHPPATPADCIFARTTACFSSDLKTAVTPCQLGGNPDCARCGCIASAGLQAVGDVRLAGILPLRAIYESSDRIGRAYRRRRMTRRTESPVVANYEC